MLYMYHPYNSQVQAPKCLCLVRAGNGEVALPFGIGSEGYKPTELSCKGTVLSGNFHTSHNDKDDGLACVAICVVQDSGLS